MFRKFSDLHWNQIVAEWWIPWDFLSPLKREGCSFPRAVVTNYHKLRPVKQQNVLPPKSAGWKSEVKAWQSRDPLKALEKNPSLPLAGVWCGPAVHGVLGFELHRSTFCLSSHGCPPPACVCVSSYKDTIGLGPPLSSLTSSSFISSLDLQRLYFQIRSHSRYQGWELEHVGERHNSQFTAGFGVRRPWVRIPLGRLLRGGSVSGVCGLSASPGAGKNPVLSQGELRSPKQLSWLFSSCHRDLGCLVLVTNPFPVLWNTVLAFTQVLGRASLSWPCRVWAFDTCPADQSFQDLVHADSCQGTQVPSVPAEQRQLPENREGAGTPFWPAKRKVARGGLFLFAVGLALRGVVERFLIWVGVMASRPGHCAREAFWGLGAAALLSIQWL